MTKPKKLKIVHYHFANRSYNLGKSKTLMSKKIINQRIPRK